VLELFKEHNVEVSVSEVSYHKSTSIVERFNRTLSERIFKQIHQKEMMKNRVVKTWHDLLQPTIDQLNNEKTRLTNIEPSVAIDMPSVKQHPDIELDSNKKFKVDDIVRYRVQPDLVHDISRSKFLNNEITELVVKKERRRATDATYSLSKHKIIKILDKPGLPPLYYLNGIKHGFTSYNLELVN